jgi:hypothetical protein
MKQLKISIPVVISFLLLITACGNYTPRSNYRSVDLPPNEAGKCYAKSKTAATTITDVVSLPMFTGLDSTDIEFDKYIYQAGERTTKWVKKKADKKCLSANPDDCLVWCLVDVVTDEKSILYLKDTTATDAFVIQEVEFESVVSERQAEWVEVVCENDIDAGLIMNLCASLITSGYDPGSCEGKFSNSIKSALRELQEENGLPIGSLNIATLDFLEIEY